MIEIKNEKIFDLMADKTFEQLSKDEKEFVLKEMSKDEYNELQNFVGNFKSIDDRIEINTNAIIASGKDTNAAWWNYRMPYYQVAAVVLIAISTTFVLTKSNEHKSTSNITDVIASDTVYTDFSGKRSVTLEDEEYPEEFIIRL